MKNIDIGKRIREIRKEHRYSLQDLSRLAKCSVNYISQLERGLNSPTIETLMRITEALGIRLVDFFSEKGIGNLPRAIRKKDRKSFSGGIYGVRYEMLCSPEEKPLLDAFLVTLKPKSIIGAAAHEKKGSEFLHVLSGVLNLNVKGTDYRLFPGDSICYKSGELHQLENKGKKPVEVISVSTPPRF